MMTQNIDIGKEKLYISTDLDARRASLTLLSPRVKNKAIFTMFNMQIFSENSNYRHVEGIREKKTRQKRRNILVIYGLLTPRYSQHHHHHHHFAPIFLTFALKIHNENLTSLLGAFFLYSSERPQNAPSNCEKMPFVKFWPLELMGPRAPKCQGYSGC